MTILEQAQRGVGMAGRASHLFFPGWNASAVSRTVGWFPESAKGTEPYEGVQPPISFPQSPHFPPSRKQKLSNLNSSAAELLFSYLGPVALVKQLICPSYLLSFHLFTE